MPHAANGAEVGEPRWETRGIIYLDYRCPPSPRPPDKYLEKPARLLHGGGLENEPWARGMLTGLASRAPVASGEEGSTCPVSLFRCSS